MSDVFVGAQFRNYRIVRLLGRGGNARVYLGQHVHLKRFAAIKILKTSLTRQDKEQFLDEARMLANLAHPHIVHLFDFDSTERFAIKQRSEVVREIPFLVMEYASRGSLRDRYPVGTRAPLDEVVDMIKQAAAGLQYAHDARVMHRDVKPENLLLNERQEVMLSDFGLAMFAPKSELLQIEWEGTPYYMAPEQWRGHPCFASDQYALGVIVYEWLSGQPPFVGDRWKVVIGHVSDMPASLCAQRAETPPAVEAVVFKALAKEPERRYGSVREFAEALEDASKQKKRATVIDMNATVREKFTVTLPALAVVKSGPNAASLQVSRKIAALGVVSNKERVVDGIGVRRRQRARTVVRDINRVRMLKKVRSFWITGVLERSLRDPAYMQLELDERKDAVASTWPLEFYQRDQRVDHGAMTQGITEIYDQVEGELLILGEAGAGKTTLLLELARDLLKRAERDESQEIPVIFLLSSWVERCLPIEQWLVEELNSKYQVPRELGARWVADDMLVPLLDGLDEVPEHARAMCVMAINAYRKEHGLSPLVICSRTTDYLLRPPRVLLSSAVVIRPLTMQQIEPRLLHAGKSRERVLKVLRNDPVLQEMVTTPLMLNVVTIASQKLSFEDLHAARSSQERYRQLFATYTEQMLQRRQQTGEYTLPQAMTWLAHIAGQMKLHNQTMYYIEQIQPGLIEKERFKRVYDWMGLRLIIVLIGACLSLLIMDLLPYTGDAHIVLGDGLIGGLMGYLLLGVSKIVSTTRGRQKQSIWNRFKVEYLLVGMGLSLIAAVINTKTAQLFKQGALHLVLSTLLPYGLASLLLIFFLMRAKTEKSHFLGLEKSIIEKWLGLVAFDFVVSGVVLGLVFALAAGSYHIIEQSIKILSSFLTHATYKVKDGKDVYYYLGIVLRDGLRYGVVCILLSYIVKRDDGLIHPMEVVSWSWKNVVHALRNAVHKRNGIAIALVVGLSYYISYYVGGRGLVEAITSGIILGLITGLLYYSTLALFQGFSSKNLDEHERILPNEGIKRSLYTSMKVSVAGLLLLCTFFLAANIAQSILKNGFKYLVPSKGHRFTLITYLGKLGGGFLAGWSHGRVDVLLYGTIGVVLIWLLMGGQAVIRHILLRIILWLEGKLPWNVAHFLDYANSTVLMRKVGGGYMFVHRLLQEYFVSIEQGLGRRKEITDAVTLLPIDPFDRMEEEASADLEQTVV